MIILCSSNSGTRMSLVSQKGGLTSTRLSDGGSAIHPIAAVKVSQVEPPKWHQKQIFRPKRSNAQNCMMIQLSLLKPTAQ